MVTENLDNDLGFMPLLDAPPPGEGYERTDLIAWKRSARHGGTILVQRWVSVFVDHDPIWVPVPTCD